MHWELIKNDNVIIRSSIVFDTMQLQCGIGWDINQNKSTGADPTLSFDAMNNILKK